MRHRRRDGRKAREMGGSHRASPKQDAGTASIPRRTAAASAKWGNSRFHYSNRASTELYCAAAAAASTIEKKKSNPTWPGAVHSSLSRASIGLGRPHKRSSSQNTSPQPACPSRGANSQVSESSQRDIDGIASHPLPARRRTLISYLPLQIVRRAPAS